MKLYGELASWWPLVSPPEDYAPEAALYLALLREAEPLATVLELGSGGGHVASHLGAAGLALTLVDRSPDMLAVSRALNPGSRHLEGDMTSLRLDETFDAVFVQDALTHLRGRDELLACVRTAAHHCRPGGRVLLAPDWVAERFEPGTSHDGRDGDDGRGVRWTCWTHPADPATGTFRTDYAFLLREADGSVRVVHDHHLLGLHDRETWMAVCRDAGLVPERRVLPLDEPEGCEVFLCERPA